MMRNTYYLLNRTQSTYRILFSHQVIQLPQNLVLCKVNS